MAWSTGVLRQTLVSRAGSAEVYPKIDVGGGDNIDYPHLNASYWVSSNVNMPPAGVNLGSKGNGLLYQAITTVSGQPYATPSALNLSSGNVVYGASSGGGPTQDNDFNFVGGRLTVGATAQSTGRVNFIAAAGGVSAMFADTANALLLIDHVATTTNRIYAGTGHTLWLGANGSSGAPGAIRIAPAGTITAPNLAGGGTAFVTADSTGMLIRGAATSSVAPVDARYWVSQSNATLTNEVDMGLLTNGLLYHSVSGGVSTPVAMDLPAGAVVFGAPSGGGPFYDASNLVFDDTNNRLIVAKQGTYTPAAGSSLFVKGSGNSAIQVEHTNTNFNLGTASEFAIRIDNTSASGQSLVGYRMNNVIKGGFGMNPDGAFLWYAPDGAYFYQSLDTSTLVLSVNQLGIRLGGVFASGAPVHITNAHATTNDAILMDKAATQRISKTGGQLSVGTADANSLVLFTGASSTARITVNSSGTTTFNALTGASTVVATLDASGNLGRGSVASFAPADATYWTSSSNATLTAEVNMGALSSGLLYHSVSGSVSTPNALALTSGNVVFGTSGNAPSQDNNFNYVSGCLTVGAGTQGVRFASITTAQGISAAFADTTSILWIDHASANLVRVYGGASATLHLGAGGTSGAPGAIRIATTGTVTVPDLGGGSAALVKASTAGLLSRAVAGTDYVASITAGNGIRVAAGPTVHSTLVEGLAGGQTVVGGTASGENLTFSSTTHATKGAFIFGSGSIASISGINGTSSFGSSYPGIGRVAVTGAAGGISLYLTDGTNGDLKFAHVSATTSQIYAGTNVGLTLGAGNNPDFVRVSTAGQITVTSNAVVLSSADGSTNAILMNQVATQRIVKSNGTLVAGTTGSNSFQLISNGTLNLQADPSWTTVNKKLAFANLSTSTAGDVGMNTSTGRPLIYIAGNAEKPVATVEDYGPWQFGAYGATVTQHSGPVSTPGNYWLQQEQLTVEAPAYAWEYPVTRSFTFVEISIRVMEKSSDGDLDFWITKDGSTVAGPITISTANTRQNATFTSLNFVGNTSNIGIKMRFTGNTDSSEVISVAATIKSRPGSAT